MKLPQNFFRSFLLIGGIVSGSLMGVFFPIFKTNLGHLVEYLIMVLVFLLFFEIHFKEIMKFTSHMKFISVAWFINFVVNPLMGALLALFFIQDIKLVQLGLFIYFLAPCTDWFLGFSRAAKGNTSLGAILVPLNMISQILLFPIYIYIFAESAVPLQLNGLLESLFVLFFFPFITACIARTVVVKFMKKKQIEKINYFASEGVFFILFLVIFTVFYSNVEALLDNLFLMPMMVLAIISFFILSYFIAELACKIFGFDYKRRVLLTFSTAARNSQLMVGITAAVFPDQPLLYAAIIFGMLIEFPHLIIITEIFIQKQKKKFGFSL